MSKLIKGVNDLQSWCIKNNRQDILEEWDYDKNNITPDEISHGSHKTYWFKCKNGHSYQQALFNKTSGNHKCPICCNQKVLSGYNDLKTWCIKNNRQDILQDWDYNKNKVKPEEVNSKSKKKYWFKCKNNHEYLCSLGHKSEGKGCPYCSNQKVLLGYNDLYTWCKKNNREDILDSFDDNNKVSTKNIFYQTTKKYIWNCPKGHKYLQSVRKKVERLQGCPYCSNRHSVPELTIYELCKKYDNNCKSGKRIKGKEIDIFIPSKNICTEYDGAFYHNSEDSKIRENNKNISILEDYNKYTFIRIKETNNPDNLKKFKEILPSGLIIYYISNKYDEEYFQRLSDIIKDMLNIFIDYKEIQEIYRKIKISKNS